MPIETSEPKTNTDAGGHLERLVMCDDAEVAIGSWLSAALDDPDVCAEMKRDIVIWFTFIGCSDAKEMADKIIRKHGEEFACKLIAALEEIL